MTAPQELRTITQGGARCTLRQFAGPEADEFFLLCRPEQTRPGAFVAQTEAVYRILGQALQAHGGGLHHVVHETIFFRSIADDLATFQRVRSDLLRELSVQDSRPASTCIEQPPLNGDERLELSAFALVPRRRKTP